jgi:hypothetical protein
LQALPFAALQVRQSRLIITSALDDELALDSGPVDGHSLFTGCLIEGLTGGLPGDVVWNGRPVITGSQIAQYVRQRVQTYPGRPGWRQTPDFGCFDFDDRGEMLIPVLISVRSGVAAPKPVRQQTGERTEIGLFAAGVPLDTLPLSIAIETLGGVSSILIPRGTPLPTIRTQIFSTAADNQLSVEVHALLGERSLARDNHSLGKFQLSGIQPAAKGVPQIEVTFAVDAAGVLTISAMDLATRTSRLVVTAPPTATGLDKKSIDRVLADTVATQTGDNAERGLTDARNRLHDLIYTARTMFVDLETKISDAMRTRGQRALRRAEKTIDTTDAAKLAEVSKRLEAAVHEANEALYQGVKH